MQCHMIRRLPHIRLNAVAAVCCCALSACAHRLDVKVVDAASRAPVVGAQVFRMDLRPPYSIMTTVPKERQITDSAGLAHLKYQRGSSVLVDADGYRSATAKIERDLPSLTVELKRAGGAE